MCEDQDYGDLSRSSKTARSNVRSEMTLAFRYYAGIGTPKNCDKACHYYKTVADKAMAFWLSGPPGGRYMVKNSYRWADDFGGFYGEGASARGADGPSNQPHR